MEVNDFATWLIDATFYLYSMFKSWYLMCQKNEYVVPAVKRLIMVNNVIELHYQRDSSSVVYYMAQGHSQ